MRRVLFATAIVASALLAGVTPLKASEPLVEASTNFDLDAVPAFLARVAELLAGGFSSVDAETVSGQIAAINVEASRQWTFQVTYRGKQMPLRLKAFMDDVASPDLYFFTSAELAAEIQSQMKQFAEERGQ